MKKSYGGKGRVVGIDLGTSNSVIAVLESGKAIVLPNKEGERTTPSVIAYSKQQGSLLVGQTARRQARLNPYNTYSSLKRLLGQNLSDLVEGGVSQLPYRVIQPAGGIMKVCCPALKELLPLEVVTSHLIRKLVSDASLYLEETVTQAVITVPAYFSDVQRQATKDAATIAGLDVLRIINEPTAAALAFGFEFGGGGDETLFVFDLGGGTFDVSLLDVGDGVFEVLATSGDTQLGGDDFDRAIVDWLIKAFAEQEGYQPEFVSSSLGSRGFQRLFESAEQAKIDLSLLQESEINLPFLSLEGGEVGDLCVVLTRDEFQTFSASLLARCTVPVKACLADAKLGVTDIERVLLVGGSTRIPMVRELVRDLLQQEPDRSVNPDEVVALGAAIQGGILVGDVTDVVLLDVTPLSLGIETAGGVSTVMITRNTTIPASRSEVFSTASDNQTSVEINVLQGERGLARDNKSLGTFVLSGIAAAPRGVPKIDVSFDIDVSGLINVLSQDKVTNKKESLTVDNACTLPKDLVDRLVQEAQASADEDKQRLEDIENESARRRAQTEFNTDTDTDDGVVDVFDTDPYST